MSPAARRASLLRVLGVGFGLAVIVGNTVGAGILRTPGEVAARPPDARLFFAARAAGGLYALSFLSLFVLRRREPEAPRPYRA